MHNEATHVPKIAAMVAMGTNLKYGISTLARMYRIKLPTMADTRLVAPVVIEEIWA